MYLFWGKEISSLKSLLIYFLKGYFTSIQERGEGERIERKREIHGLPPACTPTTRGWSHNPGTCPDQQSNQWPLVYRTILQPTEPRWPELPWYFYLKESQQEESVCWRWWSWRWAREEVRFELGLRYYVNKRHWGKLPHKTDTQSMTLQWVRQ